MMQELGVPLREILNNPSLKNAKLIAGAGGLDRIVKYVNVMEVPDILEWVKEGELLLTTVYAIRNDIGAQSRLIPELAAKKLAGLAIKPGRYIEKIPEVMVEQAELNNLPLLELDATASFSDIINPILSEILNKQSAVLRRADEVHASLTQVVLDGGDLPEIANALSELLNNNFVMLETCMEETVISSRNMPEFADKAQIGLLPDKNILQPKTRGSRILSGKKISYIRTPICAGKKYYGVITVFENNCAISARDELTVERAAMTGALTIINHMAVSNVERHYCSEFINEMLSVGINEEKKIRQQGKRLGFYISNKHIAVILHVGSMEVSDKQVKQEQPEWEESRQLLFQQIIEGLKGKFSELIIGNRLDSLIIFVPAAGDAKVYKNALKETVESIGSFVRRKVSIVAPDASIYMGIGRSSSGLAGLQASYREAVQAYNIGRIVWPDKSAYYYENLGIWRLLGSITDRLELRSFVDETIGPIMLYDKDKSTDLLKTLEVYFECNGNLRKVSERMFTHYNTILYRIERIVQITGVDMNDASHNLNLQIGIKILKILDYVDGK